MHIHIPDGTMCRFQLCVVGASNVWIVQNMWNVGNVMCGNFRGS